MHTQQNQPEYQAFSDPSDFCRVCRGSGSVSDHVGGGVTKSVPCDQCGGTGFRTMRVTEVAS